MNNILNANADINDLEKKSPDSLNSETVKVNPRFKDREKMMNIIISSAIILVAVLILAVILLVKPESYYEINKETYNSYITFDNSIQNIQKKYLNESGYVDSYEVENLLNEVESEIRSVKNTGLVDSYNRDSESIYIKYSNGIRSVFAPYRENMLSTGNRGRIVTLEPVEINDNINEKDYEKWVDNKYDNLPYNGSYSVEESAKLIEKSYPDLYSFDENKYSKKNENVSVELLKNLNREKIIIFEGHGIYNSAVDSCLVTGDTFVSWEEFCQYKDDVLSGNIVLTTFPQQGFNKTTSSPERHFVVTNKFFDKYLGKMNNSLVFLGSCNSNASDKLANSFISKGAAVVLGYSQSVSVEYEMLSRTMFFYYMTNNENATVYTSINKTYGSVGSYDPWGGSKAKLTCISKGNMNHRFTLKEILTNSNINDNGKDNSNDDSKDKNPVKNNNDSIKNNDENIEIVDETLVPTYSDVTNNTEESTQPTDSPEDMYKNDFVSSIIDNESLWNTDYFTSQQQYNSSGITFMDLNFDGKPEFIVQYGGDSAKNCDAVAYYFNDGTISLAKTNSEEGESGCFQNNLTGYYNFTNGKYTLIGKGQCETAPSNIWTGNFEMNFDGEKNNISYFSSDIFADSNRDGSPEYTYYEGAVGYNNSNGCKEISQYEYDTINSEKMGELIDINMKTQMILASDWNNYSEEEKRIALIKSYDAFTYDKY